MRLKTENYEIEEPGVKKIGGFVCGKKGKIIGKSPMKMLNSKAYLNSLEKYFPKLNF